MPQTRTDVVPAAYYALRAKGELGRSVTVKLRCDGAKMHKITFYERGPVCLHDHDLRSERAVAELGQEHMPRCVQLLKTWKDGIGSMDAQYHDILKRMTLISGFRLYVSNLHQNSRKFDDADGFDIPQYKRMLALIAGQEDRVRHNILAKFKVPDNWSSRSVDSEYPGRAHINLEKIKLSTHGIGASSAPVTKHEPSKPKFDRTLHGLVYGPPGIGKTHIMHGAVPAMTIINNLEDFNAEIARVLHGK